LNKNCFVILINYADFRVVITVSVANSLSSLKPAIPLFTLPFNLVALFALVVLRVHHQVAQPTRVPPPDFDWMHVSTQNRKF
jgi:hypothetical protein